MPREWTDRELNLLDTRYGTLGPAGVARMLGRTYDSVRHKANRRKLAVGQVKGWLLAAVVDSLAGVSGGVSIDVARKHGVPIRRVAGHTMLPTKWAEQYIAQAEKAREADELLHHDFYDTKKAARILGVSLTMLRAWCRGEGYYGRYFCDRVTFFKGSGRVGNTYIFNPHDIEDLARERRKSRSLEAAYRAMSMEG